jgi:transcriptional regulator with XRE-family HTH domain
MAVEANALGDYLRARRQQVRPEDVGLVSGARRRVPGLRREELAMLAGISAEYYLRLEVGRDKHPSAQVVEALARALRLDTKATQHLHSLANPTGSDNPDLAGARAYALTELIDQFLMPAIVANRYLDVLTSNAIARALSPEFTPGQNFLRWRFLDPAAHEIYPEWGEATESLVCGLRELAGPCTKDRRMRALIDELCADSARFRELWIEGTAVGYHAGIRQLRHPLASGRPLSLHPPAQHVVCRGGSRGDVSRRVRQ